MILEHVCDHLRPPSPLFAPSDGHEAANVVAQRDDHEAPPAGTNVMETGLTVYPSDSL